MAQSGTHHWAPSSTTQLEASPQAAGAAVSPASTGTTPDGRYQFILSDFGLGSGTNYYLVTEQDQGYHGLVNEDNNGTQCFADCNPLNIGTLPEVPTAGENLRVDFFLEPALRISGRITDAVSGDPVANQIVCIGILNGGVASGSCRASDVDGFYQSGPLVPGTDYIPFVLGRDTELRVVDLGVDDATLRGEVRRLRQQVLSAASALTGRGFQKASFQSLVME